MNTPNSISVAFDYTLEEMLEVGLRTLKSSKTFRQARLRGYLITAVGTFAILCLIFTYPPLQRVLNAAVFTGIWTLVYWLIQNQLTKRRLTKYYREKVTAPWPIHLVVELNERGVLAIEREYRTEVEWTAFENVLEQNGNVEFALLKGGLIIVRARAFADEVQRQHFLAFARQHIQPS